MSLDDSLPLKNLKTYSVSDRPSLVNREAFGNTELAPPGAVRALRATLPDFLGARSLLGLAQALRLAHRKQAPILWGMGGHVLKVGLSPLLIDLMERGLVQGLAFNGSGTIHDLELAMIGSTSEDVASSIQDGSFGMARETAEFLNQAVTEGARDGLGFGAAVGRSIAAAEFPNNDLSVLAAAHRLGIRSTVHVTVGADIVHMHGSADGAAIGQTSMEDFRRFTGMVARMQDGAYLNCGSAVTLPEVFLKAVSTARNLGFELNRFTTANLDQLAHYRPRVNVLQRPGGVGFDLRGAHEVLIPLLRWLVLAEESEWKD